MISTCPESCYRNRCRMAEKKGKKKSLSPPLSLFSGFEETNNPPEPSPSYFTELPISQGSAAPVPSTCGDQESTMTPRPAGVKLYFRPGLSTDAVREGLQQALGHECTVQQIDLGCTLQVTYLKFCKIQLRVITRNFDYLKC